VTTIGWHGHNSLENRVLVGRRFKKSHMKYRDRKLRIIFRWMTGTWGTK
jgi:hypothetical protein